MENTAATIDRKLVTPLGAVIDFILAVAFFVVFTLYVIPPHVPAEDPTAVLVLSAYTSFCIAGVFWMALMLFRVTRVDQARRCAAAG